MDRLERLINLTAALLETNRPLSRRELHERVPGYSADDETFRRAFERDKDALRSMGVPLNLEAIDPTNPDSVDGYRIHREEYELPDPGLTSDELRALHVAVAAIQLTSDGESALRKLGGTLGGRETLNLASIEANSQITALFGAVTEKKVIKFMYRNAERVVEPQRLTHYRGRWYLQGFDRSRDDVRSFRIDRISGNVSVLGEDFERSGVVGELNLSARAWELGDDEPVDVRFYVDKTQVDWVAPQLSADSKREDQPDGGAIFTMRVSNRTAFRSFALGLLDHTIVLEPQEIRSDIVSWLEEFVA